jgi:hypothetical protein
MPAAQPLVVEHAIPDVAWLNKLREKIRGIGRTADATSTNWWPT